MNVSCPNCQTVFRVDPEKIPATGVKARCSRCSATLRLDRSGATLVPAAQPVPSPAAQPAPQAAPPVRPPAPSSPAPPPQPAAPAATPRPLPPPNAVPLPPPMAPVVSPLSPAAGPIATTVATPAAPAPPPPTAAPATPPAAAAPTGAKRGSFRNQDPQARAHRIARALVSDIVAYNKAKMKESRAAGTLRTDFREEIRKSWEEYVEQVGLDMAKSTPYFRNSLNEILAEGQNVF